VCVREIREKRDNTHVQEVRGEKYRRPIQGWKSTQTTAAAYSHCCYYSCLSLSSSPSLPCPKSSLLPYRSPSSRFSLPSVLSNLPRLLTSPYYSTSPSPATHTSVGPNPPISPVLPLLPCNRNSDSALPVLESALPTFLILHECLSVYLQTQSHSPSSSCSPQPPSPSPLSPFLPGNRIPPSETATTKNRNELKLPLPFPPSSFPSWR
jgi:hypothetical protein